MDKLTTSLIGFSMSARCTSNAFSEFTMRIMTGRVQAKLSSPSGKQRAWAKRTAKRMSMTLNEPKA